MVHHRRCFSGLLAIALLLIMVPASPAAEPSWEDVLQQARGQTVNWFMWGGQPAANAYVNGYVAARVKALYGIDLRQAPVQDIAEVVKVANDEAFEMARRLAVDAKCDYPAACNAVRSAGFPPGPARSKRSISLLTSFTHPPAS